jgi:hypothetical protein
MTDVTAACISEDMIQSFAAFWYFFSYPGPQADGGDRMF